MGKSKLWGGGFSDTANLLLEEFWGSISFDHRLAEVDITGSIAHASMLGKTGIISIQDSQKLIDGLSMLLEDAKTGKLEYNTQDEDIHMNIERLLTERIGAVSGKLHTARSRNDQVALDMHLFVRQEALKTQKLLKNFLNVLVIQAEENLDSIMPGYTHLQRAQPVTFAQHLMAYSCMFWRDHERLDMVLKAVEFCPLGSGALAGTTFPIDREYTSTELGFKAPCINSMDGVGNRDFVADMLYANSMIATHLSRLCEEVILWVSSEFGFISLTDAYTTGSSMMPQKKNADLAELVRGKTGRVYGSLITILTVMKGLPLTYNKDFQEDKECLFDSIDTVQKSLFHLTGMMKTLKTNPAKMLEATKKGFLNATDVADYLAARGIAFREAHEIVAKIIMRCHTEGRVLEDLTLSEYQEINPVFNQDIYDVLKIENVLNRRQSYGSPAPNKVKEQINQIKKYISNDLKEV